MKRLAIFRASPTSPLPKARHSLRAISYTLSYLFVKKTQLGYAAMSDDEKQQITALMEIPKGAEVATLGAGCFWGTQKYIVKGTSYLSRHDADVLPWGFSLTHMTFL